MLVNCKDDFFVVTVLFWRTAHNVEGQKCLCYGYSCTRNVIGLISLELVIFGSSCIGTANIVTLSPVKTFLRGVGGFPCNFRMFWISLKLNVHRMHKQWTQFPQKHTGSEKGGKRVVIQPFTFEQRSHLSPKCYWRDWKRTCHHMHPRKTNILQLWF